MIQLWLEQTCQFEVKEKTKKVCLWMIQLRSNSCWLVIVEPNLFFDLVSNFLTEPQYSDPFLISFPCHSHTPRDSYGSGMGVVWSGGPTLVVPEFLFGFLMTIFKPSQNRGFICVKNSGSNTDRSGKWPYLWKGNYCCEGMQFLQNHDGREIFHTSQTWIVGSFWVEFRSQNIVLLKLTITLFSCAKLGSMLISHLQIGPPITGAQGTCIRFRITPAPDVLFFWEDKGRAPPGVVFFGRGPQVVWNLRQESSYYIIYGNRLKLQTTKANKTPQLSKQKTIMKISPIEQTYDQFVQIYNHWNSTKCQITF